MAVPDARPMPLLGPLAGAALLLVALLGQTAFPGPCQADEAPQPPAAPLIIGIYALGADAVVDGDTLRVGENVLVRISALDCEEVFKSAAAKESAEKDFAAYAQERRGEAARPVKFGTPAGMAAAAFVKTLVKDATHVRLERDQADGRTLDTYGRVLGHAFLILPDAEINLAEVVIRQGHSPYFTKYGRSLRFDSALCEAQRLAQAEKLGIWAVEGPQHYPDYPERLSWWNARADQITQWQARTDTQARVTLGEPGAAAFLKAHVGKPIVAFGLLARHLETESADRTVLLFGDARASDLAAVIFSKDVLAALDGPALDSMYVTITGTVTLYQGRPQIVIQDPQQIVTR